MQTQHDFSRASLHPCHVCHAPSTSSCRPARLFQGSSTASSVFPRSLSSFATCICYGSSHSAHLIARSLYSSGDDLPLLRNACVPLAGQTVISTFLVASKNSLRLSLKIRICDPQIRGKSDFRGFKCTWDFFRATVTLQIETVLPCPHPPTSHLASPRRRPSRERLLD